MLYEVRRTTNLGAYKVLVSFPDFKSGVACHKWAGWVRFPHAPANLLLLINKLGLANPSKNRGQTVDRIILKRVKSMMRKGVR